MTNVTDFTNPLAADAQTFEQGFKTCASFGERISGIVLDAAADSNEIVTKSASETIANLRDVVVVRDDLTAYGQVYADFARKQAELALRTAEALGNVVRAAQAGTGDLVSNAGEQAAGTAAANVDRATRKAASAGKKAA